MKTEDIMRFEAFFEKHPALLVTMDTQQYMDAMNELGKKHPPENGQIFDQRQKEIGTVQYDS